MSKFLLLSLALVCLLAGCSVLRTDESSPGGLDGLDAYFEEEPEDNEMGAAEFGLQDPMDTVYTYHGEPLEIPFSITGASSGKTTEIGVLLFVDGVVQPYSAVYEDGTELEESYMQVFNLEYEQQEKFNMVFQPATGKSGETVPVMAVTILEPGFVAEGPDNPRYGFHHQESATTSRRISFAADAPEQTLAVADADYNVVNLPQNVVDTLAAWGATDSLDTTAALSLGVEDGNYIQADGKTATVSVQLYGGPETDFNITLFINHQPVQLNGADYLSVQTVKNQMAEATFQIDTSELGPLNTIYAIAVTPEDGQLEINNPVKTASVLLLNEEADSRNDFLSPEYDYAANKLKLTDLSTGDVKASYSFDAAQTPLLTDKTSQGAIVMLSSQAAADVQNTGGITVISGDSSAETLYYWLFDQDLNLVKEYELTDETLVNGLWSSVLAVAPGGTSLVYAEGSSLYQYIFDTQELTEITPVMSETIYFEAVGYSGSGDYLAFFGSVDGQENTTAYGSIDLGGRTAAVFTADSFSGSMLSVNGEYAAISDTILPASMGGAKQTGSVLFLDLAQQQGKAISVESGDESGIVAVSADGQYIVTCVGGDSPSGTMRAYQVSDGTKTVDETYTMDTNCKPYEIWVIGHFAYAALGMDDGYALSQAVALP